jgi:excisionase family DNA binding protein
MPYVAHMVDTRSAAPSNSDDDLLTVAPAARVIEMSEGFVRKAANEGRLPFIRAVGGQRLFRRGDLDRFRRGARCWSMIRQTRGRSFWDC